MISLAVIVSTILSDCTAKRCLAETNQLSQAFVFYRSHKSFCESVTVRCPNRASNRLHAFAIQKVSERIRVFRIAINDEEGFV